MSSPKQLKVKVKNLKKVKPDIFLLSFDSGYLAKNSYPGQFIHVRIEKTILRRPFSIHYIKGKTIYVLFRIKGRGTKVLSRYKNKDKLDIIGPLGIGFSFAKDKVGSSNNILVAGGLGVAPLLFLSDKLKGFKTTAILGAKSERDVVCEEEFKKRGCKVYVTTEDGSKGKKATSTDLLKDIINRVDRGQKINIYSCGPEAMFKEIKKVMDAIDVPVECEISFEQFMGCGLGVCCACVIETQKGFQKVCKDGPVFNLRDIWG